MENKIKSDVKLSVRVSRFMGNTSSDLIAMLVPGNDANVHSYVYGADDDYSKDFDESTATYQAIAKAFAVADYTGKVEVIVAPNSDVTNGNVQPTSNGANVSATNKYVYALSQHLNDGFTYVVVDQLSEKDVEPIADYVYSTQKALLLVQLALDADHDALKTHCASQKTAGGTFGTTFSVVADPNTHPLIQTAAYATANRPIDLMHVGNLGEFAPYEKLSMDDIDHLEATNGNCIVNKADDMMMLSGKTIDGGYADEFVNTKYVKDAFQYDIQKQLNTPHIHFDDDGINLLAQTAQATGRRLYAQGFLDSLPVINKKTLAQTSDNEKATRTYNGLEINAVVMSSIEKINLVLTMAE